MFLRRVGLSAALLSLGACSALIDPDTSTLGQDPALPGDGDMDAGTPNGDDGSTPREDAALSCDDCDDGVACTTDECVAELCTHTPDDAACQAGERCNAGRGCVPERCTENADCDDGNVCNGVETCAPNAADADARTGCAATAPLSCDDGVDCTLDRCDPAQGCLTTTDDAACGDGVNCTLDTCTPSGCEHEARQALCDVCFVGSFCSETLGCMGGIARSCSDGDLCTLDSCDVDMGECIHTRMDNELCALPPDACDSAEVLTLDGDGKATATGSFGSLNSDYNVTCGAPNTRDAVFAIDVTEPSDIILDATGSTARTALAVGPGSCSEGDFNFACAGTVGTAFTGGRIILHNYDPATQGGRLFVLVDALSASETGNFTLAVQVTPYTSDSDTCDGPLDLSPGGILVGFIDDRAPENDWGDLRGACQSGNGEDEPEAVFALFGAADGTVALLLTTDAFTPVLYARGAPCDSRANDTLLGCEVAGTGNTAGRADFSIGLDQEERAFVIVDGGRNGAKYTLRVTP